MLERRLLLIDWLAWLMSTHACHSDSVSVCVCVSVCLSVSSSLPVVHSVDRLCASFVTDINKGQQTWRHGTDGLGGHSVYRQRIVLKIRTKNSASNRLWLVSPPFCTASTKHLLSTDALSTDRRRSLFSPACLFSFHGFSASPAVGDTVTSTNKLLSTSGSSCRRTCAVLRVSAELWSDWSSWFWRWTIRYPVTYSSQRCVRSR